MGGGGRVVNIEFKQISFFWNSGKFKIKVLSKYLMHERQLVCYRRSGTRLSQ